MKRITFFLIAILIALVCVGTCKAQTTVYNGQQITASDTVTVELEFSNVLYEPAQVIYIQVDSANTGTIKFTVERTGTSTPIKPAGIFKSWGAGARIPMTIDNGKYNLFYKASASGNAFTITN